MKNLWISGPFNDTLLTRTSSNNWLSIFNQTDAAGNKKAGDGLPFCPEVNRVRFDTLIWLPEIIISSVDGEQTSLFSAEHLCWLNILFYVFGFKKKMKHLNLYVHTDSL